MSLPSWSFLPALLLLACARLPAQAPFAPEDDELTAKIEAACELLRGEGRLVTCAALLAGAPTAKLALPFVAAGADRPRVEPADLHDLVRRSLRAVGHYYHCADCGRWHFDASSGFCLDGAGHVVTCAHVLPAGEGMGEAFLVSADLDGNVWPVERLVGQEVWADVAVLATAERGGPGLPLAVTSRVGARVYCLSNPDGQYGYFAEGMVARRYFAREPLAPGEDGGERRGPQRPRLDVTCEFAKGSSGAPIVDATGAVIGVAQATLTVVYDEDAEVVDTQLVVRSATPVESLRELLAGAVPPVNQR